MNAALQPIVAGRRIIASTSAVAVFAIGAALSLPLHFAHAQTAAPATQAGTLDADAIKQREQELEAARKQQQTANELEKKLKADIAAIGQDRSKLNQQLIDIAGRVRGIETKMSDTEKRSPRSPRCPRNTRPRCGWSCARSSS